LPFDLASRFGLAESARSSPDGSRNHQGNQKNCIHSQFPVAYS